MQTTQEVGFDMVLPSGVKAEVRILQYADGSSDEYSDAMDWTTVTTSGAQQFLFNVDKAAIAAGGPTIMAMRFSPTTGGMGNFNAGSATFIKNWYEYISHWAPETRVTTICDEKDTYRFGYNGMEKDNEAKGLGNSLDFGARIHDPRLGRFLSIDAMAWKSHNVAFSPYNFVRNNPIIFIDPDGNDWILSTGNKIYWYGGETGDKKNLLATYKASSGSLFVWNGKVEHDYRNSKFQSVKDLGPTPEGKYFINLKPQPDRIAKIDFQTPYGNINRARLLRSPEGGIEKIPGATADPERTNWFWSYENWGKNRAHLEPVKVTGASSAQRDNTSYYIHDSEKGGTHGCTEVETQFFDRLTDYRAQGNSKIDVIVDYPSNNYNTDGGTNKTNIPSEPAPSNQSNGTSNERQ